MSGDYCNKCAMPRPCHCWAEEQNKTLRAQLVSAEADLAAANAEREELKRGKALADGMANMIRGFIFKTVERETLDEVAAKYRKWEEDYCHRGP